MLCSRVTRFEYDNNRGGRDRNIRRTRAVADFDMAGIAGTGSAGVLLTENWIPGGPATVSRGGGFTRHYFAF